jgi:C4-dicarboxylate-specific signal transduction histidine kinase
MSVQTAAIDADPHAAVLGLLQQAELAQEQVQFAQVQALAERAVEAARELGDPHLLGWGLMLLGDAASILGRPVKAYAAASEAYDLLGTCGDVARQIAALETCSSVAYFCGDTARSIQLHRQALAASAHRPDCAALRCKSLINLSLLLHQDAAEYAEGIQCCAEAAELAMQLPQDPGWRVTATTRQAYLHVKYADALADQGKHAEASAQLAQAAQVLPTQDPRSWRSFSFPERNALMFQVVVLAALGRWPMARLAAAATLHLSRLPASPYSVRIGGLESLYELHLRSGRLQRAMRYTARTLEVSRNAGEESEPTRCLQRLAKLHAQAGAYDQALACGKELQARQSLQSLQANVLHCRLAAIERQADRRRYQAREALGHAQRIAVIGRLIAQTHHALSAPIERAHSLAAAALALAGQPATAPSLGSTLEELSHCIDRAAALASQLKLFSYRSMPQPMALSLRDALLSAWHGLAPHLGTSAQHLATLDVADPARVHAWADAQRLGIMLKVLLIELTKGTGSEAAPNTVRARIERGEASTALLHIEAGGRAPAHAQAATDAQQASTTLGVTLCVEIAGEMGGALHAAHDEHDGGSRVLRYRLQLPDAPSLARELPQALP